MTARDGESGLGSLAVAPLVDTPTVITLRADARALPVESASVDLVVTSPPYWRKRNYGFDGQIGQESTVEGYVEAMVACLSEWRRTLRPTGSVFLNVGDTFHRKSLVNAPARIEIAAASDGWKVRNRIIWTKDRGMPEPVQNRLAGRHEYVIHLVPSDGYYYDLFGYAAEYGNGSNPGDVWPVELERNMGAHLAPFPADLVRRAVTLACPERVCSTCGAPSKRIVGRTMRLDPSRPQAKRAMELAEAAGLTEAHIAAIQATGISDVGKATRTQNGTGRNSERVQTLAIEAKAALGGYFREFTFAQRETTGWTSCCDGRTTPGVVLDPFMGTGTTVRVAAAMRRSVVGVDLSPEIAEVVA